MRRTVLRKCRAQVTKTGVPTGTRAYSAITSGIRIRTQPWDAVCPIDPYSLGSIPWIPAPPAKPIQRAFIGSCGPGGITFPASAPAHDEFGTYQDGLTCFHWML